jgi:hypothetical protein
MNSVLTDYFKNFRNNLEVTVENNEGFFYRVLSVVLSSIFFANIPTLLFLIYMGHYGFFSYDFFYEGLFALKVFFLLSSVFMLIMSMMTFVWVLPIVEKIIKGATDWWFFILILSFNLCFLFIFIYRFVSDEDYYKAGYFLMICFFVSLHFSLICYAKPAVQFRSLVVFVFMTSFMSLNFREQAASLVTIGLKTFSVGGEISVNLKRKFNDLDTINGKLILTTPKHIYIKINGSRNISTIDRSKIDEIITINY